MKKLILLSTLLATFTAVQANPEPIIYGTITADDGKTFTGSIRWGDQETFLSDIFNGRRMKHVGIEHMSDDEISDLEDHQPGPKANFGDIQITFKSFFGKELKPPFFNVNFGAIKTIDVDKKSGILTATLHDGSTIVTNDSSNDLTDEIYVLDNEGNQIEYDLDELTRIVFSKAPDDAKTWGDGIYGTVTTATGRFQGRVMWDKDERMTTEELDGNDDTQEYEIKFADILSIEKNDNASNVVLRDGRELKLTGTNDVNNSNRGIWLDHPDSGRIEINWEQFNRLDIQPVTIAWLEFDDYANKHHPLSGTITLKDDSKIIADQMVFDLNHQSTADLIEVEVDGATLQFPMIQIKQLKVKNDHAVELTLQNQTTVLAYGNRNVTRENNGLMVTQKGQNQWVQWADVQSITFD